MYVYALIQKEGILVITDDIVYFLVRQRIVIITKNSTTGMFLLNVNHIDNVYETRVLFIKTNDYNNIMYDYVNNQSISTSKHSSVGI